MPEIEIAPQFIQLGLVIFFSFLIGLEQGKIHRHKENATNFGTARTFTFIGILGYILYSMSPSLSPFLGGGAVIALFLSVYYYQKASSQQRFGFTSMVLALIVYCLTPLIITQPTWLSLLLMVVVLIFTEIKEQLHSLYHKIDNEEFVTLAKFIVITGVILPALPKEPLIPGINISAFNIWMAMVVISGISYISYLLKYYVFPESGTTLSGILGGFYSSTATTWVMAKKSREPGADQMSYASAILYATVSMYLRIQVLAFVFNPELAGTLFPYMMGMVLVGGATAWFIRRRRDENVVTTEVPFINKNPLELKTAFLFALLYVGFSFLTHYVVQSYGESGIKILSWIIGLSDISPFIMNIFQGGIQLDTATLVLVVLQAVASNNLMKMIYAYLLVGPNMRRILLTGFGIILVASVAEILILLSMS